VRRRGTLCERGRVWELRDDGQPSWLADRRPSRAVRRNMSIGNPWVFGVEPNRFEHEVEFVGAVDLACYRVGHSGPEEQGFGEVIEPVNALRVEVPQQEHRTLPVFRP
jgi:hypothetical protein